MQAFFGGLTALNSPESSDPSIAKPFRKARGSRSHPQTDLAR
jgi:hypothetical protein